MKVVLYCAAFWVGWSLVFLLEGWVYVSLAAGLVGLGYLVAAYFRRKEEK